MNADQKDLSLDAIRREIDAIDDQLLDLLTRRIAAAEKVRASKTQAGSLSASPIRPNRESQILRRLTAQANASLSPGLLVRLWRIILSTSTLAQAPVNIHIARSLGQNVALRVAISEHFGATPVEEHDHDSAAVASLQSDPGDICLVKPDGHWFEAFVRGLAGGAGVIGSIPAIRTSVQPALLILGHAQCQPTGEDETLVLSTGNLPRDFNPAALWQVRSGTHVLSCLPGFLSDGEGPLAALMRSNATLGLRIAGRYPSPLEVLS